MLRAIFRFGVLLLPLLSGVALLAYTAAHSEDTGKALREFLHPGNDCAAPCWQGIRPGVTHSFEAVALLETMPWVTDLYTVQGIAMSESFVRWDWTGEAPTAVDVARDGQMWLLRGLVYAIDIPLAVPFSEIWGAFGAPDTETYQTAPLLVPPRAFYHAYYFGGALDFRGSAFCPLDARSRLAARLDAHIASPEPDAIPPSDALPCPSR